MSGAPRNKRTTEGLVSLLASLADVGLRKCTSNTRKTVGNKRETITKPRQKTNGQKTKSTSADLNTATQKPNLKQID